MNVPAIILAGGLGTRLRNVVKDLPKPMAPVNGKPFLHYLFTYLKQQGVHNAILSVGYKADAIRSYFGDTYNGISILYMEEAEPLGTGGGIYQAISLTDGPAYVLNGDTFFNVDLKALFNFYLTKQADIALSLKHLQNFDRYGTLQLNEAGRVISFSEKKMVTSGLINGGVYVMSKESFGKIEELLNKPLPQKFSFEKDILETHVGFLNLEGKVFENYFIDIGIPEDYEKVQTDFAAMFGNTP
ncbi:MAG: nucleotidyltransferase family protein [Chitinophagales bacterium]|nr:nucleotidyltransferase family protein [Chitinophagales bacterium]